MIWLAGFLLVVAVGFAAEAIIGMGRLDRLADCPPFEAGDGPKVSIVVAARDEERNIEKGVGSMLAQQYPALEVVVVDDRSTDRTGAILDRLAAADSRLTVVHLTELPSGWLGKNHALQRGAERASGDWLLFADGDVEMAPDALSRAVRYAESNRIDHLAAAPDMVMPGLLLSAFTVHFLYSFLAFSKPWKARDPKSWFFVGIGAFNLVRRSVYQANGGHTKIALRPDDDLKLGKVIKRAGFRQDCVVAARVITVEWYHSLGEMIRGLEKNMFAGVDYKIWLSILGGVMQLLQGVLPPIALFLTRGPVQLLFALQVVIAIGIYYRMAREARMPAATALIYPVVILLFVYILWRTMILNLVHGGLQWRGTFYSLRELKANRV